MGKYHIDVLKMWLPDSSFFINYFDNLISLGACAFTVCNVCALSHRTFLNFSLHPDPEMSRGFHLECAPAEQIGKAGLAG